MPTFAAGLQQEVDMSNFESTNSRLPISSSPLRTWDFLETTLVVLIAYGVFTVTARFALVFMLNLYAGTKASPAQLQALWLEERWQSASLIAASLPPIAVVWVAIRMAGRGFAEYLALNWPTRSEFLRALAIMAIVVLAEDFVAYFVGELGSSPTNNHVIVRGPGGLLTVLISYCIAAPIFEELVVRGFMFRGWSQSFLGPIGAIVLTSAVWAISHTQYDWFGRLEIFGIGLALGHFRWRSDSTWLAVMVHSGLNTFFCFTMGPYV